MRSRSTGRRWVRALLVGAVLGVTALAPLGTAVAAEPAPKGDSAASSGSGAAPTKANGSSGSAADGDTAGSSAASEKQARDQAAKDQAAKDAAAEAQARAQAAAEARAARLAQASARARASWDGHGRPARMILIKLRSVDLVQNGRVLRQVPRAGGALTLSSLDRFVPNDWLSIANGQADLSATIVLSTGMSLTLGGDAKTVRLAGGPDATAAASIYSGRGRLTLRGVTVGSFDPATGQAVGIGPGRPFIVVGGGGRFEATDSAINDLGTAPTDPAPHPAVTIGEGATGSVVRTTFARNSIGLKLDRTNAMRLEALTVSDSADDGLVLRGDRGTTLIGITTERNGGNGVLVTGPSSDRPITAITASGNKQFGLALLGQTNAKVDGVTTSGDGVGGVRVSWSTGVAVTNLTTTDDPIGLYTHVGSGQITVGQSKITGARRGLQIEKTTRGLTVSEVAIADSSITGVSIGGHDIHLRQLAISSAATGVRVERGAGQVTLDGVALTGGGDGLVALSATKDVVVHGLTTDGVSRSGVRTFSPGLQIVGGRLSGGETGIDAGAATSIAGTTIVGADEGIRSRPGAAVDIKDATVSAIHVGVNVAATSPTTLAGSRIDALEAIRGVVPQVEGNVLSLPPLNLLGAIGVPLILVALILEQVQAFRLGGSARRSRRVPPAVGVHTEATA